MARELVGDVRATDTRLKNLTRLIADTVTAHGTRLPTVGDVGPVVAARPLEWTGRASRFPTSSAFANYAGRTGRGGQRRSRRHRLARGGDRQLYDFLHIAALAQVRMRTSTGRRDRCGCSEAGSGDHAGHVRQRIGWSAAAGGVSVSTASGTESPRLARTPRWRPTAS
jgi:hypothetical protein